MDEQPRITRRWYQFRLSTILVLVGILAWAMARRPWINWGGNGIEPDMAVPGLACQFYVHRTGVTAWLCIYNEVPGARHLDAYGWWLNIGPTELIWPILALVAFLTWKLGWAIAARRKRRREAVPLT